MAKVTIKAFGLQSNTDSTIYATWTWTKSHTKEYKFIWYYATGDGVWFIGNEGTTTSKQTTYSAPSNATKVKFKVKPISTTHKVNKKDTNYWIGSWSTEKQYSFSSNPPGKPNAPEVKIEKYKLTAELNNIDIGNAFGIQFQVVKNDKKVIHTGKAIIKKSHAAYSCTVDAGSEYKVRCRGFKAKAYKKSSVNAILKKMGLTGLKNVALLSNVLQSGSNYYRITEYGDWSEYSSNVATIPSVPKKIITLKALSETSAYIDWENVKTAKNYTVQYTTKKAYFDSNPDEVKSATSEVSNRTITGMESGSEYFFRVRASNDQGDSGWSEIKSIVIGKDPAAPTTWSSSTTLIAGEELILYWIHNSEDGSSQTLAQLEINASGTKKTHTINKNGEYKIDAAGTLTPIKTYSEEDKDKTTMVRVVTTGYTEGTQIEWRVRTAGVTKVYGDWSVQRTVNIYAPPTLELEITDSEGTTIDTITSFPFHVRGFAGPSTQSPIGYHLSVIANESYKTVDQIGNKMIIKEGDAVYSNYFDTTTPLHEELSAGNIDLENNKSYTVYCVVSMNSGLTAEASSEITVYWDEEGYEPDAEFGLNMDDISMQIMPYCKDEYENYIEGVTLSVYRREYDGTFMEIATGLANDGSSFIIDEHPALDYARYRIVATTTATGTVSYYDCPGQIVDEYSTVFQWDEDWSYFETNEDEPEAPPWRGSMLKLPYNISVSDKHDPDVELVEYIGRKHPVSYYGTQVGEKSTWSVDIDKDDIETLYSLRRLAVYMGDVYVREPSGSGYWANVNVSFSQKYDDLVIPVTFEITRVEGGA